MYRMMPDGPLRRRLAALYYGTHYGAHLRTCRYRRGAFELETCDGVRMSTIRDFDPAPLTELIRLEAVRPGDWVFDLGGNYGAAAIYMALKAGPQGRVFVYEPDEANLVVMRENLTRNRVDTVTPVALAVSDHTGRQTFFAGGNYTSSLQETDYIAGDRSHYKAVEVELTTIDEECRRLGIGKVDLIKMDIEGSEGPALRGAADTIRRFHPRLVVETHIVNGQSNHPEVEALIQGYGYTDIDVFKDAEQPIFFARK
jgi:FkbM family methyltransferase